MAVAAREGLSYLEQLDFAAGAFPGLEEIPDNGAEDIVDGLLAADGQPYRRGPSVYKGTVAASSGTPWRWLWDGYLPPGARTVAQKSDGHFHVLDAADTTWLDLGVTPGSARGRPVVVSGMLVFGPSATGASDVGHTSYAMLWGGARSGFGGNIDSLTVTNGSRTVTGAGTPFAFVEAGTIIQRDASPFRTGVVESVESTSSLTLSAPWQGPTETTNYGVAAFNGVPVPTAMLPSGSTVYLASMFGRLVVARGNRLAFTAADDPFVFANPDDYHELPAGAQVTGLEPLRDQLLVFTTEGVFALSGLAFDLTDAQGNVQQRLERTLPELSLRDDRGLAGWQGTVVAPAMDDIYLIDSAGSVQPLGGGMRALWRSYVKKFYTPGFASVFQGHYVLPVLSGNAWVDTLVCNLRTGAWTRFGGHLASSVAFTRRHRGTAEPRLFSAGSGTGGDYRIVDATNAWDPGVWAPGTLPATDADGSPYDLSITTRTFSLGGLIAHTWKRFRARLEGASSSPNVSLEYATGKPGSSFTSVSSPQVKTDDNEQIYSWAFREKSRAIRFRLKVRSGGVGETLRSIQAGARASSHHRP